MYILLRIVNPICPGVFLSDHAPERKGWENSALEFGTVILCNATKKLLENFFSRLQLITAF